MSVNGSSPWIHIIFHHKELRDPSSHGDGRDVTTISMNDSLMFEVKSTSKIKADGKKWCC